MKPIKRLLIDTNPLSIVDPGTGIQRVVKNITAQLAEKCTDVQVIPFRNYSDRCVVSKEVADHLIPNNMFAFDQTIELQEGDYILTLDLIIGEWKKYFNFYNKAKKLGIPIAVVSYDLIPHHHPYLWPDAGLSTIFNEHNDVFFNYIADDIICISKTVADEVLEYFKQAQKSHPNISYWHLGSNISPVATSTLTRLPLIDGKNYLLMVGTIEPRKNHKLAIAAMQKLWEEGSDLGLVIIGREGWLCEEVLNTIRNHPEHNKKLFYFGHASDDVLLYCYKNCKALLQLSLAEGFGLPLIEASKHGAEIVCSDIPIFREVADGYANFVSLDLATLTNQIREWYNSDIRIDSKDMSKLSWSESCDQLIDVIFNDKIYAPATKAKVDYNTFYNALSSKQNIVWDQQQQFRRL